MSRELWVRHVSVAHVANHQPQDLGRFLLFPWPQASVTSYGKHVQGNRRTHPVYKALTASHWPVCRGVIPSTPLERGSWQGGEMGKGSKNFSGLFFAHLFSSSGNHSYCFHSPPVGSGAITLILNRISSAFDQEKTRERSPGASTVICWARMTSILFALRMKLERT